MSTTSGSCRSAYLSDDGEALRVGADLALIDDAALMGVDELDRILDRDHVPLDVLVDAVEHRGERRRLARARRAGDENQAARTVGEIGDDLGQVELLERLDLERNLPDDHRHAAALLEAVAAEARQAGDAEREVQLVFHLEALLLVLGQHRVGDLERVFGLEDRLDLGVLHLAVDAKLRANAGGDVQIRRAPLDDLLEEIAQVERLPGRGRRGRRRGWRRRGGRSRCGGSGHGKSVWAGRGRTDQYERRTRGPGDYTTT